MSEHGPAVTRLAQALDVVALARVYVPAHTRLQNGRDVHVDAYWRDVGGVSGLADLTIDEVKAIVAGGPKFQGLGPLEKRLWKANLDELHWKGLGLQPGQESLRGFKPVKKGAKKAGILSVLRAGGKRGGVGPVPGAYHG